jgi:hypothetical protein
MTRMLSRRIDCSYNRLPLILPAAEWLTVPVNVKTAGSTNEDLLRTEQITLPLFQLLSQPFKLLQRRV